MGPVIASPIVEPADLQLGWSRGLSLTARILAVNLFVLALLGAGLFFLDSYRVRLIEERQSAARTQTEFLVRSLPLVPVEKRGVYVAAFGAKNMSRIRIYDGSGRKLLDSFELGEPTYVFRDPEKEPVRKIAARFIDRVFDFLVLSPELDAFIEPKIDTARAWPELRQGKAGVAHSSARFAPDLTHVISAGAAAPSGNFSVLSTANERDIRLFVRAERFKIGMFFLLALGIGILLSMFLARTIVRPLRHLARAAVKVRLGRAQEVTVPRLPSRRDEIGMLARALSDMSIALRQRIDATEAFAADVAHEIKNPLASLRSALDGAERIEDPALRKQLMDVAKADVLRMDRLISDISDASRVDSQLAKAKFEPIDLGDMIEQLLQAREHRDSDGDVNIAYARPHKTIATVMGEDVRLERMLTNLIDNAVSFSPRGSVVEISATLAEDEVIIRVSDEGPGVPEQDREAIFRRFHSERPASENFGKHSGLGLAIARTIVEGHHGRISVRDRVDGKQGACFEIALPCASSSSQ
ncbi:HAMP domain-containing protein [Sphingorhabdus sp. IMCC26285]|uniref:histidine kinase n=1 Tax=Sphingorhabdus profundilacus TaxID=2509718 RepID=A0A6I4LUS1_9SPHN|nr:ATP-binding protein [Sphingorhabdus profundilacus]MVZ97247.1 HAMP domain-containing protein [Sphingorhabdus profundilacus]